MASSLGTQFYTAEALKSSCEEVRKALDPLLLKS